MKNFTLLLAVCAISTSVFAGVRIGPGGITFPTIQAAVDASADGDRLHVSTGEYAEIVIITNRNIIIEGGYFLDYTTKTNDPSTTIVNGGGAGSVFSVLSNSTVTFEYLNICSGVFWVGGGIRLDTMCTVTARQCRVYDNQALGGGGMYAPTNSLIVVINTIIDNNMAGVGGAIFGEKTDCRVIMEGPLSQCYGNFAELGGGIAMYTGAELIVQGGADIFANVAVDNGGGIYLVGGSDAIIRGLGTSIGNHVFAGNAATNRYEGLGGGAYVKDSTLTVEGPECVVMGNFAENGGGGIHLTNSMLIVKNGGSIGYPDFWFANYTDGVGGGIYALDSSVIVTNNATVIYGIASAGGGIFSFRSDVSFYDSTLGATNLGASSIADAGGGLYSIFSQLLFNNSRIIDNSANVVGGGMYIVFSNDLLAVNTEISGNTANSVGGGIFADSFFGSCVLDNTRIISNVSHSSAGGIAWNSIDTLIAHNGTEISYNFASNNFGGVWLMTPGTLSFRDTDISHNTAVNGIGGMGSTGGGHIDCIDCNMNNNNGVGLTLDYPGGLYLYKSSASLIAENRDCEIMRNTGICGGGIGLESSSKLEIIAPNSNTYTIGNNHSIFDGGGLFCKEDSAVSIYGNVIFNENTGVSGGGLCASNNCEMTLEPTNTFAPVVSGNTAFNHGGGVATLSDTKFDAINCEFSNNTASNLGGGVFAYFNANINIDSDLSDPSSSILPRSSFINNSAGIADWGGGIMMIGVSNSAIANTLFVSNTAGYAGSAICSWYSYAGIENVIAVHNESPNGAVTLMTNPDISLYNCTIADNGPTGVWSFAPATDLPDMQNCIVWGHPVLQVTTNMDVQFSDIQGGYPGPFNINSNPDFSDPAMLDYQLTYISPCINSGATLISVTNDCIGTPRPLGGAWDIGAYEFFGAAIIQVSPPVLDFGDVVLGDYASLTATVENVGTTPLTGDVINVNLPFAVFGSDHYELDPLNSKPVVFHFTPVAEEVSSNTVTFTGGGDAKVLLTGTGIPEPGIWIWIIGLLELWIIGKNRRKLIPIATGVSE